MAGLDLIALGQAYAKGIQGGGAMSEEEFAARGANRSLIHIDTRQVNPDRRLPDLQLQD